MSRTTKRNMYCHKGIYDRVSPFLRLYSICFNRNGRVSSFVSRIPRLAWLTNLLVSWSLLLKPIDVLCRIINDEETVNDMNLLTFCTGQFSSLFPSLSSVLSFILVNEVFLLDRTTLIVI